MFHSPCPSSTCPGERGAAEGVPRPGLPPGQGGRGQQEAEDQEDPHQQPIQGKAALGVSLWQIGGVGQPLPAGGEDAPPTAPAASSRRSTFQKVWRRYRQNRENTGFMGIPPPSVGR